MMQKCKVLSVWYHLDSVFGEGNEIFLVDDLTQHLAGALHWKVSEKLIYQLFISFR